ncbi:hypothetical protein JX266_010063 [Neoarthrinium moseri]|uniref:uncharacterized protein n=1 Tax=Neoarthrinium moseri TaxID=1658444 RepID=UPI001FDC71B6|nr:uncharacterized protein JN550_004631 [Neoarthrinium moseri]KAI1843804.1 hypothetical protein JX266_010063 [Neoarthrinium moseri]KAI1871186.1 hypothetical protein JN550_004631 [Neoarthrinium moseri]
MDTERLCGVAYPWLNDSAAREASIEGWHQLLGSKILVLEIDCNHFEVFDAAHVADVSKKLEQACQILCSGQLS